MNHAGHAFTLLLDIQRIVACRQPSGQPWGGFLSSFWILTQIQGCLSASSERILFEGLTVNIWLMRFLASGVTVSHSGEGYCEVNNNNQLSYKAYIFYKDYLRRMRQPWFGRKVYADLHPKRVGNRPEGCRGWPRRPICPQLFRKALFSAPRDSGIQECQRSQTMLVGRLVLQLPDQNQLISLLRLFVLTPKVNFRVWDHDGPPVLLK